MTIQEWRERRAKQQQIEEAEYRRQKAESSKQEAAAVRSAAVPAAVSPASCRQSEDAPPDSAVSPASIAESHPSPYPLPQREGENNGAAVCSAADTAAVHDPDDEDAYATNPQPAGRGAPSTERRRDPELLRSLGVTEEELQDPAAALLSGGVQKMWAVINAMRLPYMDEPDYGYRNDDSTPIWQTIVGFHPGSEMSPDKREERVELLVNVVLKLLREEYKIEQNKPNKFHTPFWDPLPKVCSALGIAKAHLSRLSKEACGLAAHELVDALHVETVKDKMKDSIRKFVEAMQAESRADIPVCQPGQGHADRNVCATITAAAVWLALRNARRGPQFHRGAWALSFGFANYLRLYRACLFYHKMAPSQVEFAAIEEVVAEMTGQRTGCGGEDAATTVGGTPALRTAESACRADIPVCQSSQDRADKNVCTTPDPLWAAMKNREVQFFTPLASLLWSEALDAAKRRFTAKAG